MASVLINGFLNCKQTKFLSSSQNVLYFWWKLVMKKNSSSKTLPDVKTLCSNEKDSLSFCEMMSYRKTQARKSIVVQVNSRQSVNVLHKFCSLYVPIEKVFYYSLNGKKDFVLMEFESVDGMKELLKNASFVNTTNIIPVTSQFFCFKSNETSEDVSVTKYEKPEMAKIIHKIQKASSVSHQMNIIYNETKLQDFGIRLRFLVCNQLEMAFSSLFSSSEVKPFGSSVNGFGKFDGDLDMVYDFDVENNKVNTSSPLCFQAKASLADDRIRAQRSLEIFSNVLSLFLPGCINVQPILRARVPIVRFNHSITGLDCDLSVSNRISVRMSELLYLYGESDERVRPLVFTVLRWAKANFLTQKVPGSWLTSFQFTVLVLFFLQQGKNPVISSLGTLIEKADEKCIIDNVDCSFLSDVSRFPKSHNTKNLSELLHSFFEFYEQFDFKDRGISLVTGTHIAKPDFCPVYIQNPLETTLNAAKNATTGEIKRIKQACREILWSLENDHKPSSEIEWGLLNCFRPFASQEKPFRVHNLFSHETNSHKKRSEQSEEYIYVAKNSKITANKNSQISDQKVINSTSKKELMTKKKQKKKPNLILNVIDKIKFP